MKEEDIRAEIRRRMDRETHYVSMLRATTGEDREYLKMKLEDNDKSLRLLGKYLEEKYGDGWEKFYRENYWEKKGE